MPKVRYGDIDENMGRAVAVICSRPCASFLSMKLRRIRRALMQTARDGEADRHKFLDQFAEKNDDGTRKTELKIEGGIPVLGKDGEPIKEVIFADPEGFRDAMTDQMNTEIEFEEFIHGDDLHKDLQPESFIVSSDELDALGALFVDPAEIVDRPKKPRRKRKRPATKSRGK